MSGLRMILENLWRFRGRIFWKDKNAGQMEMTESPVRACCTNHFSWNVPPAFKELLRGILTNDLRGEIAVSLEAAVSGTHLAWNSLIILSATQEGSLTFFKRFLWNQLKGKCCFWEWKNFHRRINSDHTPEKIHFNLSSWGLIFPLWGESPGVGFADEVQVSGTLES